MPAAPAVLQTDTVRDLELLRVGVGNGRRYTADDLQHLLDADQKLRAYGYTPYMKLGHNRSQSLLASDGLPNAGNIQPLRLSADGQAVVADVTDVPKQVARLIQTKNYGPRSAELWVNQQLIPDEPPLPMALRSAAWLGGEAPALKNLNDIEALYHREVAEASFLDDEGREVQVVALADGDDVGRRRAAISEDGRHPALGTPTNPVTHSHDHAAGNAGDADSDGLHSHQHTHAGDANHGVGENHSHRGHMAPPSDADNADAPSDADKAKAAQQARSKRYGIAVKDKSSNVTKPSEFSDVPDSQWGDPVNYRYPAGDKAHADNAAARLGDAGNTSDYSSDELSKVKGRIAGRQKALGTQAAQEPDEKNAESYDTEDSYEDIIADLYTALTEGMGSPFYGAPAVKVLRTFDDCCFVKVCDSYGGMDPWAPQLADHSELFMVPYTREAGGEPVLGVPVAASETLGAESGPMSMLSDHGPTTHVQGETMNDAEIRTFLGLSDDADIKQELLKLRAGTVSLADHTAVVERLAKIEADRNLTEATLLVDEMERIGQIAGPPAKRAEMREFAVNLCLSDRETFDTWKRVQPKVIDYEVLGDSADGRLPGVVTPGQAGRDLAKADAALGISPDMLVGRDEGMTLDQRRQAWRQRQIEQATQPAQPRRPGDLSAGTFAR